MKVKKYIITASVLCTLGVGGIIVSNAGNNNEIIQVSKHDVISSYNNLLNSEGIEYVKLTYANGEYLDMYRDVKTGRDQVDYYDEHGNLVTRDISTDFGATYLTIGADSSTGDPVYKGLKSILPEDLVEENKKLLSNSIIESLFTKDVNSGLESEWKQVKSNHSDLLQYSNKDGNVYLDSKTGMLEKREMIIDGELYQTIEFNKISPNSKSGESLFKIESPFTSSKTRNTVNLKNIEITESKIGEDPDYQKGVDSVG